MLNFQDYDNLVQSIARTLARTDLLDDIPGWVWMAECELQADIDFLTRDATVDGTSIKDQLYIDLPTDFAELVLLRFDGTSTAPIRTVTLDAMERLQKGAVSNVSTISNLVRAGTIWGERLHLGPQVGAEGYTLYYKAGVEHLSNTNHTNRILRQYPTTLMYGALRHSAPFLGADERLQVWDGFYQTGKEDARKAEWRARTGTGPLAMRPDVQVF